MRWTSTLLLIFFASLLRGQTDGLRGKEIRGITNDQLRAELTAWEVYQLDLTTLQSLVSAQKGATDLRLQLGDRHDWNLRLVPDDIRTPGYTLQVATANGMETLPPGPNKTFAGHSLGKKRSPLRLTIDQDFLYGYVRQGDHTYFLEPLRTFRPGSPANYILVYRTDAVKPQPNARCGWVQTQERARQLKPEGEKMAGECYEVEIALASDFSIFSLFGGTAGAENFTLGVLNNVQTNFDDEFLDEIQYVVATQFVSSCSTCDPWTSSTDAGELLNSFRNWGNGGGFGVPFDVASLWTDRNFDGSTIGVAWLGALCGNFRYNILEHFTSNAGLLRVLQAHELGHNFNANHDDDGDPFIMAPSVSNVNAWSNQSQSQINSYISSVASGGGCFNTCAPPAPPVAGIQTPVTHVCPGSVVPFIDNTGNAPNSWDWSFTGASPNSSTQQHPTVTYNTTGVWPVTLVVSNDVGTDVADATITVNDNGMKYLLYETFENGLGFWTAENPDNGVTWANTGIGGAQYGKRAAFVNNFNYPSQGQKDGLISPPLDLSAQSNPVLEIDYAYRRYDGFAGDILRVLVSTDGGGTFPFTVFTGQENGNGNFATGPDVSNEFVPGSQADWCYGTTFGPGCISIDLSQFAGESNVRIKIENETSYGNNMYVDNVRVFADCQTLLPPSSAFAADVTSGCAPLTVQFEDLSIGQVDSWSWSFPGGSPSSSAEPSPTVVYPQAGVYNVTLQVFNAAGSDINTQNAYIVVEGLPNASFIPDLDNLTVYFDNLSNNADSYLWDFGDGMNSTDESPTHTYSQAGDYTVTLTAANQCGSVTETQTITVTPPVSAGFSADVTSGCTPLTVQFTDQSSGPVTGWNWTFDGGDPATSTEQNPVVTYNAAGSFSVTLTVSTDSGQNTLSLTDYITVTGQPTAGFDPVNTPGQTSVDFDNSSQAADSYLWDFGDGTTSTEASPVHDFGTDGDYTVTLIAQNGCGADTLTQTVSIVTPPQAGFSADATAGCTPFTVQFTDNSSANATGWSWNFPGGDPVTSTEPDPVVTYTAAGVYDVELTVSNAAGTDMVVQTGYITVGVGPQADFSINNTPGQTSVDFDNSSQAADSYLWDFGDGTTSTEASPVHDFGTDGDYTITLIAQNGCGADTLTQTVSIVTPPQAGFSADVTDGCTPFTVQFSDASSANATGWSWNFPGGDPVTSTEPDPVVTYTAAGVYDVELTVSNAAGTDMVVQTGYITVGVGPQADFSINNTPGQTSVDFDNSSQAADSYLWDFGDGTTSTEASPVHDFGTDGDYTVTLIAQNGCGADTLTQTVSIVTPPQAGFSADVTDGCTPFTVQFSDASSVNATGWSWNFPGGDPVTSTEPDPVVTYATPGVYDVELTVSNAAGTDMIVQTGYITVGVGPQADFSINNTPGQTTVSFDNSSQAADSYLWDFGDGTTSTEASPVHDFGTDGDYTVTLIAQNGCGADTLTQTVSIVTPPQAGFSTDVTDGCTPFTVQFSDASSANATGWSWNFPGGDPVTSTEPDPVVTYAAAGVYDVELTVSNAAGTDMVVQTGYITVGVAPQADFSINNTPGQTTASFDNSSQAADSYLWDFGDGTTSTEASPVHDFGTDGDYTVTLIAQNGCGADTLTQNVSIVTPPQAGFSADAASGCAPFAVHFTNTSSANATGWSWNFPGGDPATSTQQNPVVTYTAAGVYDVELTVSNAAGTDMVVQTGYITVGVAPQADFSINNTPGQTTVSFDNSSQAADSYLWDFGDGTTSTEASPVHDFGTDGDYTVTLIAQNGCGADTLTQTVSIVTPPQAGFSTDAASGCAPFAVQFTNTSSVNATGWSWNFPGGDPVTSTEPDPVVTYATPGVYGVTLVVTNPAGADTLVLPAYISVQKEPVGGFTSEVNGDDAQFFNNSLGADSYLWDFGDGNTSTQSTPLHTYAEDGTYVVTLTVTNLCGEDSTTDTLLVDSALPVAGFTADVTEGCIPLEVNFINQSQGNATGYQWQFPGGEPVTSTEENPTVVYNEPGLYTVTLVAYNANGSAAQTRMDFILSVLPPAADFSSTVNGPVANFSAVTMPGLSYHWAFGDGASANGPNAQHTYVALGDYDVQLIVTNECGSDTLAQVITISSGPLPQAAFTAEMTEGCAPLTVQFADDSNGNPVSWQWTFPGGAPAVSDQSDPVVTYEEPGFYPVTLIATNGFGSDTILLEEYVEVLTAPVAGFNVEVSDLTVQFTVPTTTPGWTYQWFFGDGQSATGLTPAHVYDQPGEYNVLLVVSSDCGSDTLMQQITLETSSADELAGLSDFAVFPNPNGGRFTVRLRGQRSGDARLELYNAVGQLVHRDLLALHPGEVRHEVKKEMLPAGVYLLRLGDGQAWVSRKVVVR